MTFYISCSYAKVHESACTPYPEDNQRQLTSDEVNAELSRWKPSYDYGTDSVFSIAPPVVSAHDMAVYEKSCRVAEKGPYFSVPESQLYRKYVKDWPSNV